MKCMTINSSWLRGFGTFGAEFFMLLKKEEYEEILKLSNTEIIKRIKNINLSNQDVINLERIIATEFNRNFFYLQLFTGTRPSLIRGSPTIEQKEAEKTHLSKTAKIPQDKTNINLKNNYVLLLYALRISKKKIKDEQKILKEKIKHNKDLLLKAEL